MASSVAENKVLLIVPLPRRVPGTRGNVSVVDANALPFLRKLFPESVLEPIKLHVDAKRYLCAVDAAYWAGLSPASKHSLGLQGGAFDATQVKAFETLDYWQEAVRLRGYDDLAKVPGAETAGLAHFSQTMARVALAPQQG